jgi:hypothetical protein
MAISIERFRLSFFWSTSFADGLSDAPPTEMPLRSLGRVAEFSQVFDTARSKAPVTPVGSATALELPWPPKGTHLFWCRYLEARDLGDIAPTFAFYRLVPFRRHRSPVPAWTTVLPGSSGVCIEGVAVEGVFHPHMVTLGMHFTVTGSTAPMQMAESCIALRRDRLHSITGTTSLSRLDDLAPQLLEELRHEAIGDVSAPPIPITEPFSLLTVLQGQASQADSIVQDGPLHAALEAATQWRTDRRGDWTHGVISSRTRSPEDPILFGTPSSRVVWDPRRFRMRGGSALSCYHRNLFVGTLQTQALLAFAQLADEEALAGRRPKAIRDLEDGVLRLIVGLHAGKTSTYRSASLRKFIDDHPGRESVVSLSGRRWNTITLPPPPSPH